MSLLEYPRKHRQLKSSFKTPPCHVDQDKKNNSWPPIGAWRYCSRRWSQSTGGSYLFCSPRTPIGELGESCSRPCSKKTTGIYSILWVELHERTLVAASICDELYDSMNQSEEVLSSKVCHLPFGKLTWQWKIRINYSWFPVGLSI